MIREMFLKVAFYLSHEITLILESSTTYWKHFCQTIISGIFKTTWVFVGYYNIYILQRVQTFTQRGRWCESVAGCSRQDLDKLKLKKLFHNNFRDITGVTSDNKQNKKVIINFIYSTCAFLIFDASKAASHDTSYIQQFGLYSTFHSKLFLQFVCKKSTYFTVLYKQEI